MLFIEFPKNKVLTLDHCQDLEKEMQKNKHKMVLTSTQSNEQAQIFYRKIGYVDCGSLLLPNEPLEIILSKHLS